MIKRPDDGEHTSARPAASPSAPTITSGAATAVAENLPSLPPRAVEVTALIRDFGSPRDPIRAVDNLDL